MPLYEYECLQCQKHTEKRQKFSDPEITECPFCDGALQRVISAPAIAFKGGGWFKDGYGSAKPATSTSAETNGSGGEGKSEAGAPAKTNGAAAPAAGTATATPAATTTSPAPSPAPSVSNKN